MKNAKIAVCLVGVVLSGSAGLAVAQSTGTTNASFIAPAVQALSARLPPPDPTATGITDQLAGLCSEAGDAGDLAEAALLAGYDVFSVVRDTILACGTAGKETEVAALVATRALALKGPTARYLIDAGLLAAAAEINRRRGEGPAVAAVAAAPEAEQAPAQRDIERQRLERMMQKGLIDDVYREYIDEKRRQVAQSDPQPATIERALADPPQDFYRPLIIQGLFMPSVPLNIPINTAPGGTASLQ